MAGTLADARNFVSIWRGKGNEEQDSQLFWLGLLQDVLGMQDVLGNKLVKFEYQVETEASDHKGRIDVLLPAASVIVEQKSLGVDLAKPEPRQGTLVTPAQQALRYAQGFPPHKQPRYVVACNFAELWVYDRNRNPLCKGTPLAIALEDLPANLPALQFLIGRGEAPETIQQTASKEAGRVMARLHDLVAARYPNPDEPSAHHALSVLMTRLMFLMFAEDVEGMLAPNTIVYNNFVWPDPTPEQHGAIEAAAQAVLDARAAYPASTLAELYDPDDEWLYPQLAGARRALDAAVEAAYGVSFHGNEEAIVAHLFRLYAERAGAR